MINQWLENWHRSLDRGNAVDELADGLVTRWSKNSPNLEPVGFPAEHVGEHTSDWSHSLESFLLDENDDKDQAERHTQIVITAFKEALSHKGWTLTDGAVWFSDTLALRRVVNASLGDMAQACYLMMQPLNALREQGRPQANMAAFQYAKRLYEHAAICTVAENYEEAPIRIAYMNGMRAAGYEAFSLFSILNHLRTVKEGRIPRATVFAEALENDFEGKYSEILDGLFNNLLAISAQAMQTGSPEKNREAFLTLLRHKRPNQTSRFLGLQRMLDLPWLRISHVVSDSLRSVADAAVWFMRRMAEDDSDFGASVLDCGLDFRTPPRSVIWGRTMAVNPSSNGQNQTVTLKASADLVEKAEEELADA